MEDILSLAKQLIEIQSTPDNSKGLQKVLEIAENELREYTIERFKKNGIESILVYNTQNRPNKFRLILNGHLDVVPGKKEQYITEIKDKRLSGRGAYDMKAATATLIVLFKELAKKVSYPLGLQLVLDEEVGGYDGTKYQIAQGVRADFVLIAEGSNMKIINESRGILWAKVKTKGKTAHGGRPWLGENAIWRINKILNKIHDEFPLPVEEMWTTTINVASIDSSNKTLNKVADDCILLLDIRYIPEDEKKVKVFLENLNDNQTEIETLIDDPGQFTDKGNSDILKLQKSVQNILGKFADISVFYGSYDGRHYAALAIPTIAFGPSGEGFHSDNEWVDIKSLEDYSNILKDFILNLK